MGAQCTPFLPLPESRHLQLYLPFLPMYLLSEAGAGEGMLEAAGEGEGAFFT